MNYNLAVYIGRFQPYHKGHFQTLTFGFELAPKVLILVGSHPYKRTTKNPFTFSEREQMILESLEPHKATHCTKVQPINDCSSDAAWANHVDDIVKQYEKDDSKITLIGDHNDPDSKYLKLFTWDVISKENLAGVHATAIRTLYFSMQNNLNQIEYMTPTSTYKFLKAFKEVSNKDDFDKDYTSLREEYLRIK